jgi:hypothetical protein
MQHPHHHQHTPISNVRHNKWHNRPLPNFKRCMRFMWFHRAQNPIYLLTQLLEVISHSKSFIQIKPRLLALGITLILKDPISSVEGEISTLQRLITFTWLFIGFSLRTFTAAHSCSRCKSKFNPVIHFWKSDTSA